MDAVGECATRNLAEVLERQIEKSVFEHEAPPATMPPFAQCSSQHWLEYGVLLRKGT